jgi:hypothetical protein
MSSSELAPMHYHRQRRDQWVRLLLMQGQKLLPKLNQGCRGTEAQVAEVRRHHGEALYHAREVLRQRDLEWPGAEVLPVDQEIVDFLEELECWLGLIERVGSNREGFLVPLAQLLEKRIQSRLHLTHRMPLRHVMY